jgi:RNA polymerase sigma-70 factor (ECF subfamily)
MTRETRPAEPSIDLDRAVVAAVEAARTAWEGVEVSVGELAAHARRVDARADDLDRNGADFYLACALARRDPAAVRLLEQRLLPPLVAALRRMGVPPAGLDDVLQNVRVAVLAGPRPHVAGYAARSALFHWLRVVAIRVGLTSLRRERTQAASQALLEELADGAGNPEQEAARWQVGPELQRALDESLEKLSRRSRTILRMYYLDGLNIDAIGAVYRVHRATVARWLIAIRREILLGLREHFDLAPDATSADFRSFYAALRDELHLSVSRVLGSPAPSEPR